MIAKVISYGRDRHEAIVRMKRALEMSVVEGARVDDPHAPSDPERSRFPRRTIEHQFMERYAPEHSKDKNRREAV